MTSGPHYVHATIALRRADGTEKIEHWHYRLISVWRTLTCLKPTEYRIVDIKFGEHYVTF